MPELLWEDSQRLPLIHCSLIVLADFYRDRPLAAQTTPKGRDCFGPPIPFTLPTQWVNDTPKGLLNAQNHGLHLHHDILTSIPNTLLNNIGWTRCCLPCTNIYLSHDDLHTHQSTCNTYSTNNPTTPSTTNPTTSPQWAPLFAICPDSHKSDLSHAISSSPTATPS